MVLQQERDTVQSPDCPEDRKHRGTILVVDDDKEVRKRVVNTLMGADFAVVEAEDGLKAIKLAENQHFDLVLLDIVMDKMDGFKVCQFLKSKKDFYSPVIFLSTKTDIHNILLSFKLGADDYITKPFVPDELLARIEVGLRLKSYQDRLRNRQMELEESNDSLAKSKWALEKKVIELRTMFETFSSIHSTLNPNEIARGAILSMMGHKGIEFSLVLSRDIEKRNFYVPLFFKGLDDFHATDFWFSNDDRFVQWLEMGKKTVHFDQVPAEFLTNPNLHLLKRFNPQLIIPLQSDAKLHGILFLGAKVIEGKYTKDDIEFLELMSMEMSGALKKSEFYIDLKKKSDELEKVYVDTLRVLANAIEARDRYTIGHTWRVCRFAQALARELKWDESKLYQIEIGGLLHDIGKIGVDDSILRKPSPLTDDEYKRMKDHPELGAKILSNIDFLKPFIPYILFHQERYDGKGYPMQLKGKEIPAEGRLLAIADAFDAMTSDRPYRTGLSPLQAIEEIKSQAGKQFDPDMAEVFIKVYYDGKLEPYLQKKETVKTKLACPICQTSLNLSDLLLRGTDYICPICKHVLEVSIH